MGFGWFLRPACVISPVPSHKHHERTEEDEEPRQNAEHRGPLERVGQPEEDEETDEADVEPESGNGSFHG